MTIPNKKKQITTPDLCTFLHDNKRQTLRIVDAATFGHSNVCIIRNTLVSYKNCCDNSEIL